MKYFFEFETTDLQDAAIEDDLACRPNSEPLIHPAEWLQTEHNQHLSKAVRTVEMNYLVRLGLKAHALKAGLKNTPAPTPDSPEPDSSI